MEKAVVGIDVSSKDFHACFALKQDEGKEKIVATRKFKNSENGATEMIKWVEKRNKLQLEVTYVMEATGCYYENLAYYLYEEGQKVSVVLANKMKNYFKSLNIKTKTDKVDAKVIARYGIERNVKQWEPISENYKSIRDLCREILTQKKERQRAKNQLHAIQYSHKKAEVIKKLKRDQISQCEDAIETLKKEVKSLVDSDAKLKARIDKLETIPGIAFETAVLLIAETNGFRIFNSIRQVVSYAGLDVTHNESGGFKGKSRISKKGNNRIRQILYMPALSAASANKPIKDLYERVCEKNPTIKKKGVVASMRKLLVLCYVIWKKDTVYDANYKWTP